MSEGAKMDHRKILFIAVFSALIVACLILLAVVLHRAASVITARDFTPSPPANFRGAPIDAPLNGYE